MGSGRLRFSLHHRAIVRRHLSGQLQPERNSAGDAFHRAAVHELFRRCAGTPGYELSIDLESQLVRDRQGFVQLFDIDPYRREMLLSGQDEIGRTLMLEDRIAAFEQRS